MERTDRYIQYIPKIRNIDLDMLVDVMSLEDMDVVQQEGVKGIIEEICDWLEWQLWHKNEQTITNVQSIFTPEFKGYKEVFESCKENHIFSWIGCESEGHAKYWLNRVLSYWNDIVYAVGL